MTRQKFAQAISLLPTVFTLSVSLASAEPLDCQDPLIKVAAPDTEIAELTCAAAVRAKALLGTCGLTQRSLIKIDIVETAIHPSFGECLAVYDQSAGCLQVMHPVRFSSVLPSGDTRALIPPDALFYGVVTHELAHALVDQSTGKGELGAAETEFIANAFELESLDPEWRQVLLAADPVDHSGSESLVHPAIYALAPRVFANNAWWLFKHADNGCVLVQKILSGIYTFPRH